MTRAAERELIHRAEALLLATQLPLLFPLLRPDCKKFDAWVERIRVRGPSLFEDFGGRLLDDGLAALSRGECERIVGWSEERLPEAWEELRLDADRERLTVALLLGAVVAGLSERVAGVGPLALEALERSGKAAADPAETLALAINPYDLWSPIEAEIAAAAVERLPDGLDDELYDVLWDGVIAAQARHLATARHRRRLVRLVGYVRVQVPFPDFPRASRALGDACAAFERDRSLRAQVAACLLADAL